MAELIDQSEPGALKYHCSICGLVFISSPPHLDQHQCVRIEDEAEQAVIHAKKPGRPPVKDPG
jgi:hypothetical protein